MHIRTGWLVFVGVLLGGVTSAAAAPEVTFFSDDGFDVPVGTSRRMLSSLANFGDAALTVTRLEITGDGAAHFQFANPAQPSCTGGAVCTEPFTVEPGEFVELDLVCQVDRPAVFRAALIITSNAASSPSSWSMLCDGAGPHVEFIGDTAFPATRVGDWSAPRTLQIRNTGASLTYTVSQASNFASSLAADCRGDPCELPGGASRSVEIAFAPRTSGAVRDQLVLMTDQGNVGVTLTGTATGPTLTFEAPPPSHTLALGSAPLGAATPPGAVRIRNTGDEPLRISRVALSPVAEHNTFAISDGELGPFDVAPGAAAGWQVVCRPVRVGNNFSFLRIENDAGSPEIAVPLDCTGLGGALALDPVRPELPATALGATASLVAILRNAGNLPVTVTGISSDDDQFSAALHAAGLPITLPAGGTAAIDLRFAPTRPGPQAARLAFDSDGTALAITATGVGRSGRADVTPAAPAIGDVPVGTTGEARLVLANDSDRAIVLQSIAIADPTQFAIAEPSGIGARLAPGDVVPLTLRGTPASIGDKTTEITFGFDGGPATTITASVTGTAAALTVTTWDDDPLDGVLALGRAVVGGERDGLVSLTNTGTAALAIASCELTGDAAFQLAAGCPVVLAPRASADLAVQFAPDAPGLHTASLAITSDGGSASVALRAEATARPVGCAAGPGDGSGLLALAVAGALAITARGRRRRRAGIAAAIAIAGCDPADGSSAPVARRSTVTVIRAGTGDGTVASLTPGIACGAACTASFDGAIHLTATAAPGATFAGWDGACAGTGPCVVRSADSPAEVIARFDRHVALSITAHAAAAPVAAEVLIDGLPCALPCTRSVLPGTAVTLDLLTLSTFTGWSGGCSPEAAPCRLTVNADTQLIAQLATPGEQWTRVDDAVVPDVVTTIGDDPVAAGVVGEDVVVTRYTAAGAPGWRTRIAAGPAPEIAGLDRDAAGRIYVLTHVAGPGEPLGTLRIDQLAGDGQPSWSQVLPGTATIALRFGPFAERRDRNALAAIAAGGAVVLGVDAPAGTFVRAYASDGSVRWTQRLATQPVDVSIDAAGVATVASESRFGPTALIDRYDAAGAPIAHYLLPALQSDDFPDRFYQAFALASGQLVCQSGDDFGDFVRIRALDPETGLTRWSLDDLDRAIPGPTALGVDGLGDLVALDANGAVRKLSGRSIRWQRAPSHSRSPGGELDLMEARDVAGDDHGRVIVVGGWHRRCGSAPCTSDGERITGFVRVYDP